MTRPLDASLVQKIISYSCLCLTQRQIAARCLTSQANVSNVMRRHGFTPFFSSRNVHLLPAFGKEKGAWRGGVSRACGGRYRWVQVYGHPRANKNGNVLEHVLVAETMLQRLLKRGEVVHHINGDGLDNREENLMVFQSNREHMQWHVANADSWFGRQRENMGTPIIEGGM